MVNANNGAANNYQFTLKNYTQPLYYIRLKSIDKNNEFKYSGIIRIRFSDKIVKAVTVMPNPVTDKMNIRISSDVVTNSGLKVINNLGQVVYRQKEKLIKGDNLFSITNIQNLAKGIYTLQVVIDNEILSVKVIKY